MIYNPQGDVALMMDKYQQEVRSLPTMPEPEERLLRARIVFEEALEFVNAMGCWLPGLQDEPRGDMAAEVQLQPDAPPDLIAACDAIADILVVTYGSAAALGVPAYFLFQEVHRSNMTKLWPHCSTCGVPLEYSDAAKTWGHPATSEGTHDFEHELRARKRADGKVMKPPTYSPADIPRVLGRWREMIHALTHPQDQQAAPGEGVTQ